MSSSGMGLYAKFIEMNIFFDLDGTLIDSKLRLYKLFQELIPQSNLTYDEYWNLKQNKINHAAILKNYFNSDKKDICLFKQKWMLQIESDEYLQIDRPFAGVTEYLLSLKEKEFELYLVTARQFKDKVLSQLELFGWSEIFNDILVTEQKTNKADLIKSVISNNTIGLIIGDTGEEIQVGKQLSLKTVAVLTGFLNRKSLLPYHPDIIVDKITNLKI
jgi:phosphoglycolate phosphatase